MNFEVLCKRDVRSRDRDETETLETETTTLVGHVCSDARQVHCPTVVYFVGLQASNRTFTWWIPVTWIKHDAWSALLPELRTGKPDINHLTVTWDIPNCAGVLDRVWKYKLWRHVIITHGYLLNWRCASGCVVECQTCYHEVACSNLFFFGYYVSTPTPRVIPVGRLMSTSESWEVNGHTTRYNPWSCSFFWCQAEG